MERFRVDGRVALITGGTKGIGRALALALAEAGADVAVVSRKPEKEVETSVQTLGRRYMHHQADLTRRDETRLVVPAVKKALGSVDILVNNAGVIHRSPAADYGETEWNATIEVDLSAAFILSQAAGRLMLEKGRGKIVNICSALAFQGGVNVVAYAAAKHGMAGLTRALASEWAARGVNVNAIAPGYIATELTEPLQRDLQRSKALMDRTPAGRWGHPDDLAGAVVFLASPASDFVHGAILPIDGGWLTR
ncbi:MAG: SDR family oxidoreductase [Syntrophobacteraceae bacterium]